MTHSEIIKEAYEVYREALKEFAPPPWGEMKPAQKVAFEAACASIIKKVDLEALVLARAKSRTPLLTALAGPDVITALIPTLVREFRRILKGERLLDHVTVDQDYKPQGDHFVPTGRFCFTFETTEPGDTD